VWWGVEGGGREGGREGGKEGGKTEGGGVQRIYTNTTTRPSISKSTYLEIVHKLPESHFTAILLASHDIKTVPQCPLRIIVLCVCGVVCAGVVCTGVVVQVWCVQVWCVQVWWCRCGVCRCGMWCVQECVCAQVEISIHELSILNTRVS